MQMMKVFIAFRLGFRPNSATCMVFHNYILPVIFHVLLLFSSEFCCLLTIKQTWYDVIERLYILKVTSKN